MSGPSRPAARWKRPGQALARLLTYFAIVQGLHLAGLAIETTNLLRSGQIKIFAPAPPGGWSERELAVLMATGAVDALVALVTLVSLKPALRGESGATDRMTVALSAAMYSGVVFAALTVPAGVWPEHPAYWIEALLFAPFPLVLWAHLRHRTN